MRFRKLHPACVAGAKAGFSPATAHRLDKDRNSAIVFKIPTANIGLIPFGLSRENLPQSQFRQGKHSRSGSMPIACAKDIKFRYYVSAATELDMGLSAGQYVHGLFDSANVSWLNIFSCRR